MGGGREDPFEGREPFADERRHLAQIAALDEQQQIVAAAHQIRRAHFGKTADPFGDGIEPAFALRRLSRRQLLLSVGTVLATIVLFTDQWLSLTSVQIAVAVLVAILGIVNTLTVSITDRRRELGVLRAVGGLRGQIRRTIWIEALTTGTLGLTLGLVLGAVNLYYTLEIGRMDIVGMRFDYRFPVGTAALLVPIMLGAAFVAALWPAESAVRGSLVEALEYE